MVMNLIPDPMGIGFRIIRWLNRLAFNTFWRTPARRRGRLFACWVVYTVLVMLATVGVIVSTAQGEGTPGAIVAMIIWWVLVVLGRKAVDWWNDRRTDRRPLPGRRRR